MTDSILVVDIETTGLLGEPLDHVVEIGVIELSGDLKPRELYHAIVAPYYIVDELKWMQSWVFQNTSLKPENVLDGRNMREVAMELHELLDGFPATSYNFEFDFNRFLYHYPWEIRVEPMPCIMKAAGREYGDELPCNQFSGCPSAQSTYSFLCPSNPAKLPGGIEEHRALSDAKMEAYILAEMIRRGDYEVDL